MKCLYVPSQECDRSCTYVYVLEEYRFDFVSIKLCFFPLIFFTLLIDLLFCDRIGGEMVRVVASSAVDHGFEPPLSRVKQKTVKLVCVTSLLSMQHS